MHGTEEASKRSAYQCRPQNNKEQEKHHKSCLPPSIPDNNCLAAVFSHLSAEDQLQSVKALSKEWREWIHMLYVGKLSLVRVSSDIPLWAIQQHVHERKLLLQEKYSLWRSAAARKDHVTWEWLCSQPQLSLCIAAAGRGSIWLLQSARELGCPWDEATCTAAAEGGHLNVLAWAKKEGCPWNGAEVRSRAYDNENDEVWQWAWDVDGVWPWLQGSGSLLAILEAVLSASRMLTVFIAAILAGPIYLIGDMLHICAGLLFNVESLKFSLSITQQSTSPSVHSIHLWPVVALCKIMALCQVLPIMACWGTALAILMSCHCILLSIILGAVQCGCVCMVAWSLFKAVIVLGKAAAGSAWVVAMAPLQIIMGVVQIFMGLAQISSKGAVQSRSSTPAADH